MKKLLIVFLVCLLSSLNSGCGRKADKEPAAPASRRAEGGKETVDERQSISGKIKPAQLERAFIYENDLVIMKFPLTDFMEALKSFIYDHDNPEDIQLMAKIQIWEKMDMAYSDLSPAEQARAVYQMAELIDRGLFVLIDKRNNKDIRTIERESFSSVSTDGMSGSSGRRYYLPSGEKFFEIIDVTV